MPTSIIGKPKHSRAPQARRRAKAKTKSGPRTLLAATARTVGAETFSPGVGRRKTAVARVRLTPSKTPGFMINDKPLASYFGNPELQAVAVAPLTLTGKIAEYACNVKVSGGGLHGQAEAIRHGVARSLLRVDAALRPTLKPLGYLTRDSRMKERKKPGLKRARRAPQWSKR